MVRALVLLALALGTLSLTRAGFDQKDATSNFTLLNFDDVPTTNGFAKVPEYSLLALSSFDIFAPRDPALTDWITSYDLNCAVSSPNALIGSRSRKDNSTASISIANATAMESAGLLPFFTLRAFSIKPMAAPPPGSTISMKGYSHDRKEPFAWHVDFDSGYHLPFSAKMQEHSREAWDRLSRVEFVADFGEDALDWEFCIDDLAVEFFEIHADDQHEGIVNDQAVLNGNA